MKDKAISVTEAARNFADCVNRVHYQKVHFILLKNGEPLARLCPALEAVCTGSELAEALTKARLSPAEAKAWSKDFKTARKLLKSPADKWQ